MNLLPSLMLWAQARVPGVPRWLFNLEEWLFVFGDPAFSTPGVWGGVITWLKVVGLFALLSWVFSWVSAAIRTRERARTDYLDVAALVALLGCLGAVVLNVLQSTKRIQPLNVGGYSVSSTIALVFGAVILIWVERALWTSIRRLGRVSDGLVLAGIHLAVLVGIAEAYARISLIQMVQQGGGSVRVPIGMAVFSGARLGATYMGLVVLVRVALLLIPELFAMRPRRLLAIARLAIIESTRKMWAPYVVIVLFVVILAFTHWFLPASLQRPAELGRIYVGTLTLLCMLLLTIMVTVLSPISLPQDIQAQTIYTVVTKPVRKLEIIWGRMIGYMAIVTALVLLFGVASLIYFDREIRRGTIDVVDRQASEIQPTDPERARFLRDQADQLRTRMSARVPVKGVLSFIDSRGTPTVRGIDVGQELEFRSHIEGGTPAAAIWQFGARIPDPFEPRRLIDRRVPVTSLLRPGTIEAIENDAMVLEYGSRALEQFQRQPNVKAADAAKSATEATRVAGQVRELRDQSKKLIARFNELAAKAKAEKDPAAADRLRREAAALHSPPIPIEMTFTIYRTTKGRVGDPVYAEIEVENPMTNVAKFRDTFPIREYYTNKRYIPSSYLVGSLGALKVTIHCMSPTQYLGMAESDFYLLAESGNFGWNFMKGLFGIWLQAMVLTAIGVFAGTFLSWPVALLFTIAFFVAGHAAMTILRDFFLQTIVGGGPFISMIRMLSHDNQMSDLSPTLGVVVATTFDSLVMPVMSTMVYLIPNLGTLDVSNTVAEGFAVSWPLMLQNTLVALAYAVPFSIGGYFILKNREVAA